MSATLPRYALVLDPAQRLCAQLGFKEAVHFVVTDADGYLRYRGTFDDSLKKPTVAYLPSAIEDVMGGRPLEHPQRVVLDYGCPFGQPGKDCEPDPAGKP